MGKKRDLVSHEKGLKLSVGDPSTLNGTPNTNRDLYRSHTGEIHRRRKFDKNGNAYVDLDYADDTHKKNHVHDFVGKKRMSDRDPSKKESIEMRKAQRKYVVQENGIWKRKKKKY